MCASIALIYIALSLRIVNSNLFGLETRYVLPVPRCGLWRKRVEKENCLEVPRGLLRVILDLFSWHSLLKNIKNRTKQKTIGNSKERQRNNLTDFDLNLRYIWFSGRSDSKMQTKKHFSLQNAKQVSIQVQQFYFY